MTQRRLPNSRVELTLSISSEATQKGYDDYVRKVESRSQLPGFRKGQKVPLPLLIQSRGGEAAFKGEVLQQLVEVSAEKALRDWQGIALENSDRLETSVQDLLQEFEPDRPLQFKISFDVLSQVQWKNSFRDLQVPSSKRSSQVL